MRSLALVISPKIEEKLRTKHDIEPAEVAECFYNRTKGTLIDTREEHKTKPPPLANGLLPKQTKDKSLSNLVLTQIRPQYVYTINWPNSLP